MPRNKRILVFSPHPDDDVICVGATLKLLCDRGNEVKIAYMVSGNIAVRDSDVVKYLPKIVNESQVEAYKKLILNNKLPLNELLELKAKVRELEAVNASKLIGIPESNLYFLRLPFYETGLIIKKPISYEDVSIVKKLIEKEKPEIILMPGEIADPHGTHGKCIEAIYRALESANLNHVPEMWHYKGGWEEYLIYEADLVVPFNKDIMQLKVKAIKEHRSQLDPMFQGLDPRPFWKRAMDRNRRNGMMLQKLGLSNASYAELFKLGRVVKEFEIK